MKLLIIFCLIDYLLGFIVLLIKGSTAKGVMSSKVMSAGIAKKVCYITLVLVSYLIDTHFNVSGLYNMVSIGFVISEGISILETCRECGVTCAPLEKYFKGGSDK